MRGADAYNEALFSTVKLEEFVAQTPPRQNSCRPDRAFELGALMEDLNG